METVKRVGLDTNIFMGIFLEEADKLESSVRILGMMGDGTLAIGLLERSYQGFITNLSQSGK